MELKIVATIPDLTEAEMIDWLRKNGWKKTDENVIFWAKEHSDRIWQHPDSRLEVLTRHESLDGFQGIQADFLWKAAVTSSTKKLDISPLDIYRQIRPEFRLKDEDCR